MKTAGLCSVTFRGKSAEEVIALAKESRLACIEWGGDVHVPPGDVHNAKRVGELTRESGLKTLSYGSYFKCREGEAFAPVCACAEALGAKIIRIWAGEKSAADVKKEEYSSFVKRVKECAKIAGDYGKIAAFEFHGGTLTDNSESALRLLTDVGEDNVKCYFQPDYWSSFSSEERRKANVNSLKKLSDFIVGVHVYEWEGYTRFPLERGEEEWREYFKNSAALFYNLEFVKDDSEAQFRKDANTLKKWCEMSE